MNLLIEARHLMPRVRAIVEGLSDLDPEQRVRVLESACATAKAVKGGVITLDQVFRVSDRLLSALIAVEEQEKVRG